MFFLGKVTLTQLILIDLVAFAVLYIAYNRWRGKTGGFLSIECVPLYFLQLLLLLLLAPLQPEGVVIHLSDYSSKTVKIIPIIGENTDNKKAQKLLVQNVDGAQSVVFDLLHFKDKPSRYVIDFGKESGGLDLNGVEIYTTFFSYRISIISVPLEKVGLFFTNPNENINNTDLNALHSRLKTATKPPALLFSITDTLLGYVNWQELVRRALSWSLFCSLALGGLLLVPVSPKLALQHANKVNRNISSGLAYYFWSAMIFSFSLCVVVLLAEFATRFYFRDVLSTAAGVNYFYNKSSRLFMGEQNSFKFRGKQFGFQKSNKFRIVVMGDSISYGQGVYPHTLRYSELIEKRVNEATADPEIEVINLGVAGLDLPHYLNLLSFVNAAQPDFILYQWFINDMGFMGPMSDYSGPSLLSNRNWHNKLMNYSSLYFFLQRGWNMLLIRQGKIKNYAQHIQDILANDNAPATQKSNKLLLKLFDGIEEIGVPFGVALFPHHAYETNKYPFAFMHERVLKICESRNIPCLDLRKAFSPFDDNLKSLWANQLDPHPSALSHDIAATEIFEFFGHKWQPPAGTMIETEQAGK